MTTDKLTPDQERRLGNVLWWELHGPVRDGRHLSWDRSLTPKSRRSTKVGVKCGRCDGAGAIASFSVRYSGVCFACGGSGVRFISETAWKKKQAMRKAAADVPGTPTNQPKGGA